MNFFTRSILLLVSTVWLAVCAKEIYILGIIEHPEMLSEHSLVLLQTVAAFIMLRLGLKAKRDPGF